MSVCFRSVRSTGTSARRKAAGLRWQAWLAALLTMLCFEAMAPAQTTIHVDVSMANQTLEGWGTSLCWFAEGVGGWSNTVNRDALMTALFDPQKGLGLSYLRYNIGGGNDPLCGHPGHFTCIKESQHNIPGYETANGAYDWTQDASQRWVLTRAMSLGANLAEAFSNSPPYWMTVSGTAEGGVNGAPNLAGRYYGTGRKSFADYLTTVTRHFATAWGITFHHLEPVNEPWQKWWKAGDPKQEGCAFDVSEQARILQNVASSLARKRLVTRLSATDENREGSLNTSPHTAAYELYHFDATTRGDIDSFNTHAYDSPTGAVTLPTSALYDGKRLAMSEWGSGDMTGRDLSKQIVADMYATRPTAWTIWQPDWPGLVKIDYANQSFTYRAPYYVFEQFTRLIRPGFQFISISDGQSLAAFNQRTRTLVIVTNNWTASSRSLKFQLDHFSSLGTGASVYQTSPSEHFASLGEVNLSGGRLDYTVPANSVTTFVVHASYTPSVTTVSANTTGSELNQFHYSGRWKHSIRQADDGGNQTHWSGHIHDFYTFRFQGQQARVYASMAPDNGILAFSVDNGPETYFDAYAPIRSDDVFLFATPTLPKGTHTLKVRVTGLKNPAARNDEVPAGRIGVVASVNSVGQGIYTLVNQSNGKILEVKAASLANGGAMDVHPAVPGAGNERWNIMAMGDGAYRIVNVNSGLDLEVEAQGTGNGAKIVQWQDRGAGATSESWRIESIGDGTYRIANTRSGLDLQVNGKTGAVDQGQDVPGASNQHWTLRPKQ